MKFQRLIVAIVVIVAILLTNSSVILAFYSITTSYGKLELKEGKVERNDELPHTKYVLYHNGNIIYDSDEQMMMYSESLEKKFKFKNAEVVLHSVYAGGSSGITAYDYIELSNSGAAKSVCFFGPPVNMMKFKQIGDEIIVTFKSDKAKKMISPVSYKNGFVYVQGNKVTDCY